MTLHFYKLDKNYFTYFIKLSYDFGIGLYSCFSSTTYYFLSFAPFLSSFLAPLAPFLSSFFFYSYSNFFLVNLGAFIIWSYYYVKAYPLSCFSYNKNFCLAFFAFSALPGCLSYHDFLVCFYFSYCRVSFTNAIASSPVTCIDQ